jgi:GT2 family glycosyltransferase
MEKAVVPSVACIIVNWNGWPDTLQCLKSLSQSDYSNFTSLLVDNGSVNDSVVRMRNAFPDLEIIQSPANLGFGAGNNLGIRRALERDPKYIWLLNNDTLVQPNTLSALVATAEADTSLGAVGSVLHYADAPDKVQAWGGGRVNLWTGTSRHFRSPVSWQSLDFLTAASVLIPTRVLKQVGLFDERYFMYWEDTDLSFRIRGAGWKLGVAEKAVLLHKESSSSGSKSPRFDYYITVNGLRFVRKFAPVPLVPAFMLTFPRALRRFLVGEWARGWAVLCGIGILTGRDSNRRN